MTKHYRLSPCLNTFRHSWMLLRIFVFSVFNLLSKSVWECKKTVGLVWSHMLAITVSSEIKWPYAHQDVNLMSCAVFFHRHLYIQWIQSQYFHPWFFFQTAFMSFEDICEGINTGLMAGKAMRMRKSVGQKPSNYNNISEWHVITVFTTLLSSWTPLSGFVWRLNRS